jgi:DNA polymerase epsilon subunit 2
VRFPVLSSETGEESGGAAADGAAEDAMLVDEAAPPPQPPPLPADALDPDVLAARRLTRTLLDQAHLAPFPLSTRPVLWDYGSALSLYPLPTALVVADPDAPTFALNYTGCCVMNPGRLVEGRRGELASWVEFDLIARKGEVLVKGEAS